MPVAESIVKKEVFVLKEYVISSFRSASVADNCVIKVPIGLFSLTEILEEGFLKTGALSLRLRIFRRKLVEAERRGEPLSVAMMLIEIGSGNNLRMV